MKIPRNITFLLIALLFALLFWLQATLNSEQYAIVNLPLDYTGFLTKTQTNTIPSKARFRVRGKGIEIVKLLISGAHVQYSNPADNRDISMLSGTDFRLEQPPIIDVAIIGPLVSGVNRGKEPILQNTVAIEPSFSDENVQKDFIRSNFRLAIDKVRITGPAELVKAINHINTQPIEQYQLSKEKFALKLISPSSDVSLDPLYVDLIRISLGFNTRVITNVVIQDSQNIGFFPHTISIRVGGSDVNLNKLTNTNITVELDLTKEKNGNIPLKIALPSSVELLDYSPQSVYRTGSHETN